MTSLTYGPRSRGSAVQSQRTVVFATIAGLHVAAIALIVSGFGRVIMQKAFDPIIGIDIPVVERTDPPPAPPADPQFQRPELDLGPAPDLPFDMPSDDGGTALTGPVADTPRVAPVAPQPVALPVRVVGKHRLPNTDDYYPASEIRAGVEGTSTVGVCVDANGKRSSDPKVVQSSGSARLDEGAMHVLRDGRYARAMQGDEYVSNCYQFRISFKLK
jgi:TonB family protein